MASPTKKCNKCGSVLPLTEFNSKIYGDERVFLAPTCNTCKGVHLRDPLALAKHKYYVAVCTLVTLGFGTREEVCRAEKIKRDYCVNLKKITQKHAARGEVNYHESAAVEWYGMLTESIHRKIKRRNGVPPDKPRKARRFK